MNEGHSKGGFNYKSKRKDQVLSLKTTSLNDLLTIFKDAEVKRLTAIASITQSQRKEQIHEMGTELVLRNKSELSIDFYSKIHKWNANKLSEKMQEFSLDDACVEHLEVMFSDNELIELIKNELNLDITFSKNDKFLAKFQATFYQNKADKNLILAVSNIKEKVDNCHWKIRKLKLVYLINEFQLLNRAKKDHQPIICWTISDKIEDSLQSDALITSHLFRKVKPFGMTEYYGEGKENVLVLLGVEG